MKFFKKRAFILKINLWVSLSLNILITLIISAIYGKDYRFLIFAIAYFFCWLCGGMLHISYDLQVNDISLFIILLDYLCAVFISLLLNYYIYKNISIIAGVIFSVGALIEIASAVIIYYCHRVPKKVGKRKNRDKRNI